jgi:hypothetical protein
MIPTKYDVFLMNKYTVFLVLSLAIGENIPKDTEQMWIMNNENESYGHGKG